MFCGGSKIPLRGRGRGRTSASSSGLEEGSGWRGMQRELGEIVWGIVQSLGRGNSDGTKGDPWIMQFRKLDAPTFDGRGKPEECETCLLEVEKILEGMEYPAEK